MTKPCATPDCPRWALRMWCHECGVKRNQRRVRIKRRAKRAAMPKKCGDCGGLREHKKRFCDGCRRARENARTRRKAARRRLRENMLHLCRSCGTEYRGKECFGCGADYRSSPPKPKVIKPKPFFPKPKPRAVPVEREHSVELRALATLLDFEKTHKIKSAARRLEDRLKVGLALMRRRGMLEGDPSTTRRESV